MISAGCRVEESIVARITTLPNLNGVAYFDDVTFN